MFKRLTQAIFHNIGLKLLALVISLGIWFYASSRLREEVVIQAELQINPPAGYALVYQSEQTVRVRAAGPGSLIANLAELLQEGAVARYDLTEGDLNEGWAALQVQPGWLQLALPDWELVQLKFLGLTPRAVRVAVSPMREQDLPVEPSFSGAPREGLRLEDDPRTWPTQVEVRGPLVALEQAEAIYTEEISLWNVEPGTQRERVPLRAVIDAALRDGQRVPVEMELSETHAEVTFTVIEEAVEQKALSGLPLLTAVPPGFPFQAEIEEADATVSVTVQGPAEALRKITAEVVRPYVDLSGLGGEQIEPGTSAPYREEVGVSLPPGLNARVARIEPERVTVVLKNRTQ